jgi:hypothetical protein
MSRQNGDLSESGLGLAEDAGRQDFEVRAGRWTAAEVAVDGPSVVIEFMVGLVEIQSLQV